MALLSSPPQYRASDKLMTVLIVALPVVFQPELRRALEQLGRGKFYISSRIMDEAELDASLIMWWKRR